jgi:hypothetical protein
VSTTSIEHKHTPKSIESGFNLLDFRKRFVTALPNEYINDLQKDEERKM